MLGSDQVGKMSTLEMQNEQYQKDNEQLLNLLNNMNTPVANLIQDCDGKISHVGSAASLNASIGMRDVSPDKMDNWIPGGAMNLAN